MKNASWYSGATLESQALANKLQECSPPAHKPPGFVPGSTQIQHGCCFPPTVKGGKAHIGKLQATSKTKATMQEYVLQQHGVSCPTQGKAGKAKQIWKIREKGLGYIIFRKRILWTEYNKEIELYIRFKNQP